MPEILSLIPPFSQCQEEIFSKEKDTCAISKISPY